MNHARTSRHLSASPKAVLARALLIVLSAVAASSARAATFYVAPNGLDTNPGSAAAPFRQIRRALAFVAPGDTVLVADGNYLGFNVSNIHGSAAAPITLQAVGSGAVITPTTDRPDNRDTIFVTYSSYVVLDGLTSSGANRAAIRIDSSPNITVRRGVFGNNATWGIFTDFSDNLLLERNECYGSKSQHGIYVSNTCVNPTIRANRLHDNYACGLHMNGDVSQGGAGIISGALVEGNVVYNNGTGGGSGINMDGVQNSVIKNNLLYNNHASGICAYQIDASAGPAGLQILNNTVDMASNGRWALRLDSTAGPITVRNNILYNRNTARGGISFTTATDVANTNSAYNILDYVTPNDGDARYTLAQWQAQGHETGSFSATPAALWVNPSAADYHLLASAPAMDRGQTVLGLAIDLDGITRPQGLSTDIGCYEFPVATAPSAPSAPAGLTATAGDSSVNLSWLASPGAASYSVKRATISGGPYNTVASVTGTSYTNTGLTNGTTYYYVVSAINAGGESPNSAQASATPKAAAVSAATFVTLDAATKGSWKGAYGADGYSIAQLSGRVRLPSYAALSVSGNSNWTWSASSTDARALQKVATSDRIAACWYGTTFTVDVNLTDGQAHNVAFYVLDWDSNARAEKIDVLDAATNAVLNSQTVTTFNGGKYLVWSIRGHVKLRFTRTAGANAVLGGVFFR